jgi:hypothetical protein
MAIKTVEKSVILIEKWSKKVDNWRVKPTQHQW